MTSTDPISDMLTRIRNAIAVGKEEVSMPYSQIKYSVAQLLKTSGFITDVSESDENISRKINIIINDSSSNPVITDIKRLSRPGRRLYVRAKDMPTVKNGRGIVIVSTSKGIMTGEEARKAKIGGELICRVY